MVKKVKNGQKKPQKSVFDRFWPFLTFLNFFIIFLGTTHHDEYFSTKIIKIGRKLRSQWIFFFKNYTPFSTWDCALKNGFWSMGVIGHGLGAPKP